MQKSMWLLAFLPYLHWLGSLVNGAVVLTSPSPLVQPSRLNGGLPIGYTVVDKERGRVLPAAELFEKGNALVANLAPEDYEGSIPTQAWNFDPLSTGDSLIIGVSVTEDQGGVVARSIVMNGLYTIFLLMKQENDFRGGVFEIQVLGNPMCDIVMFPGVPPGLRLAPKFAHVTQVHPPPPPTAGNTISIHSLEIKISKLKPYLIRPMDELGMLINFMDMLVTLARPPADERAHNNGESNVPSSGVTVSLNLTQYDVLLYQDLILVVWSLSDWTHDEEVQDKGQGTRGEILLDNIYQGEITVVPSNSSLSESTLIEASVNASASMTTAKKRWSMA